MQSKATTVKEYLASLPDDRRAALNAVRAVILKNLDKDIEECMSYGMIGYAVPHRVFPAGYHCDPRQPLPYAGLASQKGHMSLYMMCVYGHEGERKLLQDAFAKAGKKLDMGKACIRFKKADDLPLEAIGEAFRRVTAAKYIAHYNANLAGMKTAKPAGGQKPTTKTKAKITTIATPAPGSRKSGRPKK
ncbi:DUF1801 domain-containing protein [bacterium]|nr:MAG: DUF1801 domain-containing protein [bacterium]